MKNRMLVGFLSFAFAGASFGAWYDNPTVRAKVERPTAADPHYMNLSEDGQYLLLDLNAANNPARKTLVYKTEMLALARGYCQPLHVIDQTLAGSKGGALSAARGVMIPGFGTASGLGYRAYSLADRADAGTALDSLTATGLVLDGLDFNADGTKIYSNSYADGTRGNLVVLDAADLANVALKKTIATGLVRVRSVNAYSIKGKDLVYFGEGAIEDGAAGKVVVYDAAADQVTELVADAARFTADIMCVKVSGTKAGIPMLYALLNDGRLFVYQLAPDGKSVVSSVPVKEFSSDQVAAFCGAAKTTKYRNFEVLDDASLAFFTTTGAAPLTVVGATAADDEPYALFTGNQSIDTGVKFGPNTAVVADFAFTDTETTQQFVWEGADYANNVSRIYVNGSKGFSFAANDGAEGSWQTFDVALSSKRYVGIVDAYNKQARILNVDGSVVKNQDAKIKAQTITKTSSVTIRIASNRTPNGNYAKMKLYGFKVYEKGVLVRNFVPAKSAGGEFGMRDLVTGMFATDYRIDADVGAATTKYTMSGSANVAEDPSPYIESDGTSTMNTRFCVSADSRVEVDYAFLDGNANQVRILGADGNGASQMRIGLYINGNGYIAFGAGYKDYNGRTPNLKPSLARHVAVFNFKAKRYEWRVGTCARWGYNLTDAEYNEYNVAEASPAAHPILLFGSYNGNNGFSSNNRSKCRIYRVKLSRNDVLVHDYVPCVKGGVPGFNDLVDGAFITGENVAAFKAGGNVEYLEDDAYVSTTGNDQDAQGCNKFFATGYVVTDKTRVELDYAFADNYAGTHDPSKNGDWYLFDAYCVKGDKTSRFNAGFNKLPQVFTCLAGSGWLSVPNWVMAGQTTGKDIRRTMIVDNAEMRSTLVTSGFTNGTITASTGDQTGLKSTSHLCIAANNNKTSGFAPLKIYGCRIYEDGVLQRNYVPQVRNAAPGLYDTVNETFLTPPWSTSTNICSYGGAIYRDEPSQDAYLEFTGSQYIDTGVKIGLDYCVTTDFAFTKVANKPNQQFVGEASGNFTFRACYTSGSNGNNAGFSWTCGANFTGIGQNANFQRYQSLCDLMANKLRFFTNGTQVYNGDTTMKEQKRSAATTRTLKLGSNGDGSSNYACMRLYGCKIWSGGENGKLLRDFVPYKNGDKVGLYDKVEGKVYTNQKTGGAAFGIGGQAATLVVEPTDTKLDVGESAVLKVLSPGAVSYQWYVNGVAIAGMTGETCRVDWRKGRPHTDVYSVIPVYEVNGETSYGPASSAVVTHAIRGMKIVIR